MNDINTDDYNDDFFYKESVTEKNENQQNNKEDEEENYNQNEFEVQSIENYQSDKEISIKNNNNNNQKNNSNNEKKEEYSEEFQEILNDLKSQKSDNVENNVSAFLEKDNVHLGKLNIDNDNNNISNDKVDKKENNDKKEEENLSYGEEEIKIKNESKENEINDNYKSDENNEENKEENYNDENNENSIENNEHIEDEKEDNENKENNDEENEEDNYKDKNNENDENNENNIDNKDYIEDNKEDNENIENNENKEDNIDNENKENIENNENEENNIDYENKENIENNENKENDLENNNIDNENKENINKNNEEKNKIIILNKNNQEEKQNEKSQKFFAESSQNIEQKKPKETAREELERILANYEKEKKKSANAKKNLHKPKPKLLISLKDLLKNPNQNLKINSPRSLLILYENGYTMEELLYKSFEKFLYEHKETMNMCKMEQKIRYNFYENLRLKKILNLSALRDKQIQQTSKSNYIKHNNKNINYGTNYNEYINNRILDNDDKIIDNDLDRKKYYHQRELANILERELNKSLEKLELSKYTDENEYNQTCNYITEQIYLPQNENINKNNTFKKSFDLTHKTNKSQKYDKKINEYCIGKLNLLNKNKKRQYQIKLKKNYNKDIMNPQVSNKYFHLKQQKSLNNLQKQYLLPKDSQKIMRANKFNKSESKMQQFILKQDNNKRLQKISDYGKSKKLDYYLGKESKKEKIKINKNIIINQKPTKIEKSDNERKNNIPKIQKMLKNSDDENFFNLAQEFKDNEYNANNVQESQDNKENIEKNLDKNKKYYEDYINNKSLDNKIRINSTNKSGKTKKTNKIIIIDYDKNYDTNEEEKEINDEVKKYKEMVNRDFMKKVEQERQNEYLRTEQLKVINDENIKKNLEKQFGKERSLVDFRLKTEYEDLQNDVKEFESFLRNRIKKYGNDL